MALARRRGYKTAATGPELLNEEVETVTQRYREGKGEASKWALGGGGGRQGTGARQVWEALCCPQAPCGGSAFPPPLSSKVTRSSVEGHRPCMLTGCT